MAFYQLDHEKQFMFNMKGLVVVNTVYVASFFVWGGFFEPGFGSKRVSYLSEVKVVSRGQKVKYP